LVIWPDPYRQYELLKAAYVSKYPEDSVVWYYGKNALVQSTAECRVVYVPTGVVERSDRLLYKGLSSGGPPTLLQGDVPNTIEWDGVHIGVHCFGTRKQLFTYEEIDEETEEQTVFFGLRDRVGTLLRNAENGPKNLVQLDPSFPQTDYSSDRDEEILEWVQYIRLWVPLFDVSSDSSLLLPITSAVIEGAIDGSGIA
jgi:hypothetical protein